jgi:hypothetical protein
MTVARYGDIEKKLRARRRALPPEEPEAERPPCPEARILRDFAEGRLPSEQEEAIGGHILACGECARELLAWDTVEHEDEAMMQRGAQSRPVRWAGRSGASLASRVREALTRRPAFTWATCTAVAAALVAIICLTPSSGPSVATLDLELQASSGLVRDADPVFSSSEQLHLELSLPRPAYVYVFVIHEGEASLVFPEGEPVRLEGSVAIPGDEKTWSAFAEGAYTLLVGTRDELLEKTAADDLTTRLTATEDPAAAAAGHFWGTKVVTFRVE